MTTNLTEKEDLLIQIFTTLQSDFDNQENEERPTNSNTTSKFDSIKIISKAKTINKKEAHLLEEVALVRENALKLLRINDIHQGMHQLQESEELLGNKKLLSKEAFLIHSTYHCAAESFLCIKKKEYGKALKLMKEALNEHKILFEEFGHNVEARRIHLGRNISKILETSGEKLAGLELSLQLLEYSIIENRKWPLYECQIEQSNKVSSSLMLFTINQLLKSVNSILAKNQTGKFVTLLENSISEIKKYSLKEFEIILNWLEAYYSIIQNDEINFLKNALMFFGKNNELLPDAKNSLLTIMQEKGLF